MAININPNRINVGTGSADRTTTRSGGRARSGGSAHVIPTRAEENNIPAPETLNTMIRSAVAALRDGVLWDRGTILNLVA